MSHYYTPFDFGYSYQNAVFFALFVTASAHSTHSTQSTHSAHSTHSTHSTHSMYQTLNTCCSKPDGSALILLLAGQEVLYESDQITNKFR